MITTGAHRDRLSIAFRPVLEQAVECLATVDGDHSLYVYGSVATGSARVGTSDVDLVTVGLEPAVSRSLAARLTADFSSLCRGVEIGPAQASDYEGSHDEAYGNRVFLRHYCVHLAGRDLAHGLPDCPADRDAARGFNGDIGLQADRWRQALAHGMDAAVLGRRIAGKALFAVAGLVSVHDNTWTTDRVAAAMRFGAIKPQWAAALNALITWGSGAMRPSRSEVQAALDSIIEEIVAEFALSIGLWRSDRADPGC